MKKLILLNTILSMGLYAGFIAPEFTAEELKNNKVGSSLSDNGLYTGYGKQSNHFVIPAITKKVTKTVTTNNIIYDYTPPSGGGGGGDVLLEIAYYWQKGSKQNTGSKRDGVYSTPYGDFVYSVYDNEVLKIWSSPCSSTPLIFNSGSGAISCSNLNTTFIWSSKWRGSQNYRMWWFAWEN